MTDDQQLLKMERHAREQDARMAHLIAEQETFSAILSQVVELQGQHTRNLMLHCFNPSGVIEA